jgi:hypothetical protein
MDNTNLINNIKKKQVGNTSFGNHAYSKIWYTDDKNKLCLTFSPRGGCSICFQQYLDLVGLLEDGLNFNKFIHNYRGIFHHEIPYKNINDLIKEKYTFIKFIMNPYIRAVSIYRTTEYNLSFREYLKQLVSNKIDHYSTNAKYHLHPQYIKGEEKIITKYIKINENETYLINLHDGTPYLLDVNKYSSVHHGKRNIDNINFCGDIPRDIINKNLPKNYRHFYDDEIKNLVDTFYKDDIEKYGFNFDNF